MKQLIAQINAAVTKDLPELKKLANTFEAHKNGYARVL